MNAQLAVTHVACKLSVPTLMDRSLANVTQGGQETACLVQVHEPNISLRLLDL